MKEDVKEGEEGLEGEEEKEVGEDLEDRIEDGCDVSGDKVGGVGLRVDRNEEDVSGVSGHIKYTYMYIFTVICIKSIYKNKR